VCFAATSRFGIFFALSMALTKSSTRAAMDCCSSRHFGGSMIAAAVAAVTFHLSWPPSTSTHGRLVDEAQWRRTSNLLFCGMSGARMLRRAMRLERRPQQQHRSKPEDGAL
jgi:hypothetical protein